MSVRRQTANRLTLFRTCGTCGKQIVTTADTPWVRRLAHPGQAAADSAYARRKRKLIAEEAQANAG